MFECSEARIQPNRAKKMSRAKQYYVASEPMRTTLKPIEQSSRNRSKSSRTSKKGGESGSGDKSIEPVHETAMARNQAARILCAEAPFDPGFEDVATLRDGGGGKAKREKGQGPRTDRQVHTRRSRRREMLRRIRR